MVETGLLMILANLKEFTHKDYLRKGLESLIFCNKFYENLRFCRHGHLNLSQCLPMAAAISLSRDQNRKRVIYRIWFRFCT